MNPPCGVMAVIHVGDWPDVLADLMVVRNSGCQSVWLIDHDQTRDWQDLNRNVVRVRDRFPQLWIGVNYLDLKPGQAVCAAPCGVSGVWSDHLLVEDRDAVQRQVVSRTCAERQLCFFGSVLFKGQPLPETELEEEYWVRRTAKIAAVVTISGERTGQAPWPSVVAAVAAYATPKPVAVASGVDADNILALRDAGGRCFLVNSSVADQRGRLVPRLLKRLVRLFGTPA